MIAMMIAAAAGATATGSAVDAERAFAHDAQRIGQWAAFRKWSDRDAVMFVPQATWARVYLNGRKEPVRAVRWRPTQSVTSCDGQVAITSGPSAGTAPPTHGRFTTIWMNKSSGWHWIYDAGEETATPVPAPAVVRVLRASCRGRPTGAPIMPPPPPLPNRATAGDVPDDTGRGQSGDRTIGWDWKVDKDGARHLRVFQWTGRAYRRVIDQHVPGA